MVLLGCKFTDRSVYYGEPGSLGTIQGRVVRFQDSSFAIEGKAAPLKIIYLKRQAKFQIRNFPESAMKTVGVFPGIEHKYMFAIVDTSNVGDCSATVDIISD